MNKIQYTLNQYGYYVSHTHTDFEQKFHARWRSWSVQGNWLIHF